MMTTIAKLSMVVVLNGQRNHLWMGPLAVS